MRVESILHDGYSTGDVIPRVKDHESIPVTDPDSETS